MIKSESGKAESNSENGWKRGQIKKKETILKDRIEW